MPRMRSSSCSERESLCSRSPRNHREGKPREKQRPSMMDCISQTSRKSRAMSVTGHSREFMIILIEYFPSPQLMKQAASLPPPTSDHERTNPPVFLPPQQPLSSSESTTALPPTLPQHPPKSTPSPHRAFRTLPSRSLLRLSRRRGRKRRRGWMG